MKIAAVMLTRSRPELAAAAVRCFSRQTYQNKILVILDSTPIQNKTLRAEDMLFAGVYYRREPHLRLRIGELRNYCNTIALTHGADAIAHFDDDDWSYPGRLEEQADYLGRHDAVGYNSMVFHDTRKLGDTWLYTGEFPNWDLVGASLLYPVETWKQKRFEDVQVGEDSVWMAGLNMRGLCGHLPDPKMVARFHASNTVNHQFQEQALVAPEYWSRYAGKIPPESDVTY